tara:strand:+ start:432 stop:581 length:150 start_codon:yes stop_codon:yes gene_type:complete
MPKGKGTYGSDPNAKYLTSWGKLSDKEKIKILLKERAKSDKQIKKMFRR